MGLHARRYVSCKLAYHRVSGAIMLALMLMVVTPQEVSAGQARGRFPARVVALFRGRLAITVFYSGVHERRS